MSTLSRVKKGSRPPKRGQRRAKAQAAHVVPPLVARILGDATYYGDGPPTWPNAPTSTDAKKDRLRAIKRVRRIAKDLARAGQPADIDQLADILVGCKPNHRCMSGACPECTRAYRRWFVSEAQKIVGAGK